MLVGMTSRLSAVAIAALIALSLTGCGTAAAPKPTATPFEVAGTVGVPPYGLLTGAAGGVTAVGDPCHADDGFDDIAEGAQVVVSDARGKTVGVGILQAGTFTGGKCQFPFTVDAVPSGSRFYGIHVGNSNRGTLQYTRAHLASGVHLTIGS